MRKHTQERDYLLDVLALWGVAKQAGYEPEEVKAFSFRPEFLTFEQKKESRQHYRLHRRDKYGDSEYHNCVRLHTGELKPIPITKRPKKPDE